MGGQGRQRNHRQRRAPGALDQGQGYPAAGSFTGFLIDTHGLEVFKQIYPLADPSARAKELVGKSFVEMETDWHAELDKFR